MIAKAAAAVVLSFSVVAGEGCVARMDVTPSSASTSETSRSPTQAAPSRPAATEPAVTGDPREDSPQAPIPAAPAANAPAVAKDAPSPSAVYVFAPGQVATALPTSVSPGGAAPDPASSAQPVVAPQGRSDGKLGAIPGELRLAVVVPVQAIATGEILSVDVMASSGSAVVDAPLHLLFDPSVLEFVDGTPGDFLTQGGSSIVFFTDGTSRPGDVAVAAGRVEREHGASGAGLLCRLRFRAVGAGTSPIRVGEAKVWGTDGAALTVLGGRTDVVVH
jgi:hypothetical protein